MRRAVVIRYGDPEMSAAIVEGMEAVRGSAVQMTGEELALVKAELKKIKAREARLGVRVVRDQHYYRDMIAKAEYDYGWLKPSTNKITNALWGVYGLAVELVGQWLDYFFREMGRESA